MTGELRYTLRVVRWAPLAAVLAFAVGIGTLLRLGDVNVPSQLSVAIIGAIAASVALSLDDPAHALINAVPVGARRRIGLRIAFIGPVAIVGWLLLGALGRWAFETPLQSVGARALIALTVAGIATTVVARHRRPEGAATVGAAVALGWALSLNIARDGIVTDMSTVWIRSPWTVVVAALAVAVLATRR